MEHLDDIENMTKCIQVFGNYMYKTFNVDVINAFPQTNPRKLLYENIVLLKKTSHYYDQPLKVLNNICLNKMRDFYMHTYGLVSSKKPNQRPLDRDHQLYGNRPNLSNNIPIPMNTNLQEQDKQTMEIMYQRMMSTRDPQKNESDTRSMQIPIPQITDAKMDQEDFQRKYDEMQKQRDISSSIAENENSYFAQGQALQQNNLQNNPADPQKFYNSLSMNPTNPTNPVNPVNPSSGNACDNIVTKTNYEQYYNNPVVPQYHNSNSRTLQEQPQHMYTSPNNYIVINGYDRDWVRQKCRFQFTVEMSRLSKTYKNISEIACTKLIIPSEIINEKSITNPNPKTVFTHNYRLSVPYLILQIDEINDVCDGAQQSNQKAFAHFVQDCHYNCENGRGYTIMKPLQDERKVYHPTPLASLPKLSVSIMNPNGTLFNNAMDKYSIWKVEYEEYNKQYLKIVVDKYFDKNEFFKGDRIMIQKFRMPVYDEDEDDESDPAFSHYLNNSYTYNRIMDFINRIEGHEIIECGKTNTEGYFRYFMIQAPGEFDTDNGKFVIDKPMVDLVKKHNEQNFPSFLTPSKIGHIINTTLQAILSMKIKTTMGNIIPEISPNII